MASGKGGHGAAKLDAVTHRCIFWSVSSLYAQAVPNFLLPFAGSPLTKRKRKLSRVLSMLAGSFQSLPRPYANDCLCK
jgi:hypothetical protein